jgi:TP901 family phage tail tape measure protein
VEEAMSLTTTNLAASRARLREVSAAAAASETALQRAIATGNVALVQAQINITRLVLATRELAVADVQATIAENDLAAASSRRAAASRAATQGAVAQGAALAGLRGSVIGANSAFIAGTAAVLGFGRSIQAAASLETELNVFRVTAGATADEMERVGEQAKALGRDLTLPGVTAGDAAQTFLALARAGLTVQESLDGARGVLQLAVAAQIGFAEAAQLTASALNSFELGGDRAVEVADLLTNAANASQASISDMGIALRQSAAIADRVGFTLSETVTFLTQLARAGLAGSDAGTSFRVSMQRLIAPTGEAQKKLEKLNLDLRDAAGNLRPEIFFELADALERQGRAQADVTLQTIFGNDASRAAAFFARINTKAFREQEQVLRESGSAAEVAGARNEGFAGSVENVKNQATALGIELGELALPVVGAAADTAALFFGALATQIGDTREELGGFAEDAELLQSALVQISDDSGFTDFMEDVASGARLIQGDIENAADALGGLFGVGDEAAEAAPKIDRLTEAERRLAETARDNHHVFEEQTTGFDELAAAAARAAQAVLQLANQQKGLEAQTTRARIAGDEDAEMESLQERRENLERELAAQEAIIARPGTAGDATAREAIRQRILPQLEAVNSEIENILAEQQAKAESIQRDRENAQKDQLRAREEADREFLDRLAGRRDDADRRASAAGETEGVADDIRAQDAIQALIKIQITKVRARVSGEKARKAAIRELRIAIIASRNEEAALREEQKKAAAEQRVSAILERGAALELDIELADINENDKRRVALRRRRIAQLKREAKLLKLEGNALKENRNERARIRKEIEDILTEEKKESGQSAQSFFFEQLQAQQGFASNLLGNLITGPTEGLVGVPSATTGPGRGIQTAALVQEGKAGGGPTSGQASTTNDLLVRILAQLKTLNGSQTAPEAGRQYKVGQAMMDGAGIPHGI